MAVFWIVLLALFFLWRLWSVERGLNARMDALDRGITALERAVEALRSRILAMETPEAPPSETREETAAQGPPEPQAAQPEASPGPVETVPEPQEEEAPIETLEGLDLSGVTFETPEPEPNESHGIPPSGPPSAAVPVSRWSQRLQTFKETVDWEQFTGVKLFAWLGGLALFIAAGFFVKYSIDRNLIPPALRLAIGALTGIGLVGASGRFDPERFRVMRHTLAAGGIGVLYSVVFAATLYYEYLPKPMGFGLLALVSAAAFVLAVHYRGLAIAILGALGAYAAPLLVSMGQGSVLMLVAYLSVVNVGLYQVVKRLESSALLLTASAGTLVTLFLGSLSLFSMTRALGIGVAWIVNLALFSAFLWRLAANPEKDPVLRWTGRLVYFATLAVATLLMAAPGWTPLLMVTAAQAGALCLAWRWRGWYRELIPFGALAFLVTLGWVLARFQASRFSAAFILLLCYGGLGGLGPVMLMGRYGIDRAMVRWLKIFPVVLVLFSLSVLLRQPVSFWFWPLLLGLVLVGTGISLVFRAFIQAGLLVILALAGGLTWLFHMPAEMVGIGFFIFIMAAGVILCAAVLWMLIRLPGWMAAMGQAVPAQPAAPGAAAADLRGIEQWLAAAPAGGVCVLLAASFTMAYPFYPHPGMATLICFLALVLFAAHRMGFDIPGAAALLAAAGAQAVSVFRPAVGQGAAFAGFVWAGALFLAALPAPFVFFRSFGRWRRIWYAWALFEALQALFVLTTSQILWAGRGVKWLPVLLVILKLPWVMFLLRHLEGRPQRNAVLAFHGGALLFYLSALPVLVLNHGWIGLSFVFEAAALLWLNRRIAHPGLRWVAAGMAPAGLLILLFNLPLLKTAQSLAVFNPAVLSVAACLPALAVAARWAAYPDRRLWRLDLPTTFQWLTVGTGFFLLNLLVADAFAKPGRTFQVWPHGSFPQSASYALAWIIAGALTWRLVRLPRAIRWAGLLVVGLGSLGLLALPLILPWAAAGMRPLFNVGLIVFLPLLAIVFYLFYREPWDEAGSRIKNLLLAVFLIAGFITLKFEAGTVFQSGYPFSLFSSHTLTSGAVSAAGWIVFGLGLLIWPWRLDRPFRLAGTGLILIGTLKALALPFRFRAAFGAMTPVLNLPSLVFGLCLASLLYLTLRRWDERWPLPRVNPRLLWGISLAAGAFCVLNIEIAGAFAIKGRAFSMLTHGSLSMQLAYSIGWLLFAIVLLGVGIRWDTQGVRWAAIVAIVITAFKIFIRDLWSLGQLYRVGSLFGLAVVLILVSFLYQRFLSEGKKKDA
jgi:uncharacterized membrane protein